VRCGVAQIRRKAIPAPVQLHREYEGHPDGAPNVLALALEHLRTPWTGPLALVAFGPGLTADALLVERT